MTKAQPLTRTDGQNAGAGDRRAFALKMRRVTALIVVLAVLLLILTGGAGHLMFGEELCLPLHVALEVVAIIIAAGIFSIGWHSFDRGTPLPMVVLSALFLAVGLLDFGHMLSFPGMPAFVTPSGMSKSIAFWIAARTVSAGALLLAASLSWQPPLGPHVRLYGMGLGIGITAVVYWFVLALPESLPQTDFQETGAAPFTLASEYALVVAYVLAAGLLLQHALETRTEKSAQLFMAACMLALSEVCFTRPAEITDSVHLAGHFFKVFGYLYLHRAIFVEAVREPIQKLRASEQSLSQSEWKFRRLMEFAPDAMLLIDGEKRIVMANARAEAVFGYGRSTLLGMPAISVMPAIPTVAALSKSKAEADTPTDVSGFEGQCRRRDGSVFPAEINLGMLESRDEPLIIAVVRDVTERKHFESVLLDQVTHDALTGLANRIFMNERLRDVVDKAHNEGGMLAVIFLGIDHFKRINDTFGHAAGDDVLRESARRIKECLRAEDMLARQGGDEFIVLQQDIQEERDAAMLAMRLIDCLCEPFHIEGQEIFLSASLGISVFPTDEQTDERLLHSAAVALTHAKARGRNCYCFHHPQMDLAARERLQLERHLRHAVERNELVLHYQPRISMATGMQVGMEALVRWQHPELGIIPPLRFIPVAEETGLIDSIGLWVLRTACAQAKAWLDEGITPVRVSVNISARQFQRASLARDVESILAETGLAPACLELEITETTIMKDTESAIRSLRALKYLGVGLSVDDFGTGYSSLSYLKLFPIDVLKIDRSFIKDVVHDPDDAAITRAIIALARSLELSVVAEGVESLAQAQFLKACDCDEVQGYYFSTPLPSNEMAAFLRQQKVMLLPDASPGRRERDGRNPT